MSFPVGSKIKCINDDCRFGDITIGKVYEVLESTSNYVKVVSDRMNEVVLVPERFESADYSSSKIIENEQVYMFDVDDTLIVWDDEILTDTQERIAIMDPYDSVRVFVRPHQRHIKLLTQMKGRGRFIVVWSQSGAKWANAVVNALGLDEYVDLYLTKPQGYVDDLPSTAWMKNHIYLKEAK